MYASFLRISGALYLGLFEKPVNYEFFRKLLEKVTSICQFFSLLLPEKVIYYFGKSYSFPMDNR